MTMRSQWEGSSFEALGLEISSRTVTVSARFRWAMTSPVNEGWPRTLRTSSFTTAMTGGVSTIVFLTTAAALGWCLALARALALGLAGAASAAGAEAGTGGGAGFAGCARSESAVKGASADKSHEVSFITREVEI